MKFDQDLIDIFEKDPLNIFNKKNLRPTINENDLLIQSFMEIQNFYEQNSRLPSHKSSIIERKLAIRFDELKKNPQKLIYLKKYDQFNILGNLEDIKNVDKFVENDSLGLLSYEDEDIFELKNIPSPKEKPDFVSKRIKCKNFDEYKDIFKNMQEKLKSSSMKLIRFKEGDLYKNHIFVLNGMLIFLADKDLSKRSFKGKNIKLDGRTKCIFENGTESNMLFRSLQKQLHKNGYTIIPADENIEISQDDIFKGYIYILSSLSTDPKISNINNLYKIGQTSGEVEDRVKNAKSDPTYLMADVKIISTYKIYNIDLKKFEKLIHSIFNSRCLNLEISKNNKIHKPSEWYVLNLSTINFAIQLFISGELHKYHFNSDTNDLELITNL